MTALDFACPRALSPRSLPVGTDEVEARQRLWQAYELCVGMPAHLLLMAIPGGVDPMDVIHKRCALSTDEQRLAVSVLMDIGANSREKERDCGDCHATLGLYFRSSAAVRYRQGILRDHGAILESGARHQRCLSGCRTTVFCLSSRSQAATLQWTLCNLCCAFVPCRNAGWAS